MGVMPIKQADLAGYIGAVVRLRPVESVEIRGDRDNTAVQNAAGREVRYQGRLGVVFSGKEAAPRYCLYSYEVYVHGECQERRDHPAQLYFLGTTDTAILYGEIRVLTPEETLWSTVNQYTPF